MFIFFNIKILNQIQNPYFNSINNIAHISLINGVKTESLKQKNLNTDIIKIKKIANVQFSKVYEENSDTKKYYTIEEISVNKIQNNSIQIIIILKYKHPYFLMVDNCYVTIKSNITRMYKNNYL